MARWLEDQGPQPRPYPEEVGRPGRGGLMPSMGDVATPGSGGWWWLDLDTGVSFRAEETADGSWHLAHASPGGGPGLGSPRVICYGSLEDLQTMVRGWLGDDLYVEEGPPEPRAAPVERATAKSVVRRYETGAVTGYRGPRSSPWALPLPKTVAEARSLGERAPVAVEKPSTIVWVLHCADCLSESRGRFKATIGGEQTEQGGPAR